VQTSEEVVDIQPLDVTPQSEKENPDDFGM